MAKHLPARVNATRPQCPLHGRDRVGPHESFIVSDHPSLLPRFSIPRLCLEWMGIDCTPLDRGGTIWYTHVQAEKMREHEHKGLP